MTRSKRVLALAAAAAALIIVAPPGCSNEPEDGGAAQSPAAATEPQRQEEHPVEYVLLNTGKGEILLELDREKAPLSVASFLQYVNDGFYEGTIFHRVIPGFMVQGGGFTAEMQPKRTSGSVRNESSNGLVNDRGTIAMARTSDPHSASSQFFINVVDNGGLNRDQAGDGWGYAVFGKVVAGMDAVDAIVAVPTTRVGQYADVPRQPILLESARRLSKDEADKKRAELDAD